MSNKKQSSIEWLVDQLDNFLELYPSEWEKIIEIKEKAKAMHKEEMFEYIKQKYCIGQMSLEFHTLEFEQYYNEHYGK